MSNQIKISDGPIPFGPGLRSPALEHQVGGSHYKHFVIQPGPFCEANKLTHYESNVIKYTCRHRYKNGKEDLLKARHYIDLLIEANYPGEGL